MASELELPSQDYIRERLSYDPHTGVFVWRTHSSMRGNWNSKMGGKIAGNLVTRGRYRQIGIDDVSYYAHRLAWVYIHGCCPAGLQIDHANGDGLDNRIANLRLATPLQNAANKRVLARSGFKGTTANKRKFVARICVGGRTRMLGSFGTPEEANAAYMAEAIELHGSFARGK